MIKILKGVLYTTITIVLPVLVFITGKFYINKHLSFGQESLMFWTLIVILISISLIIGCFALKGNSDLKKRLANVEVQNEELKVLIKTLSSQLENNHCESIEYMQNTRELFMEDE